MRMPYIGEEEILEKFQEGSGLFLLSGIVERKRYIRIRELFTKALREPTYYSWTMMTQHVQETIQPERDTE